MIRFRLSSLLIAMAAVAAMAALSSRAMAFLAEMTRNPQSERALTLIALAVAAIVPLAFVLVLGLTKTCFFGRRTTSGQWSSQRIDDSGP